MRATATSLLPPDAMTADVSAVRQFNRFYTAHIGALARGHLDSAWGLTEVRVLYELAHRASPTASDLAHDLKLDPGYLSKLLRRLRQQRLVAQEASRLDARQRLLRLTPRGTRTFAALDLRASREIATLLGALSAPARQRAVAAMQSVESLLASRSAPPTPYLLRHHQAGDIGWVVERHGALYAREYRWNSEFEALVAKIAGAFLERFDPARERCWIAEREGERVGSIFLVKRSRAVAQLRLLLVEPHARGLGIGERLVSECEHFARQAGYRKILLWTQNNLHAARTLYQRAGYTLISEKRHNSFGADLVAQDWELDLGRR